MALFIGVWLAVIGAEASPVVTLMSPARNVVAPGQSVDLSVSAAGSSPLSYQWLRKGHVLPGATGSSLPIASANYADDGWYCVDATDATGTTRSAPMFVSVAPPVARVRAWGDVSQPLYNGPPGPGPFIGLSAKNGDALAIKADGSVLGWGASGDQVAPPDGLAGVVAVANGRHHFLALRADGTVAAWGQSSEGQLAVPVGLANVVAIAASGYSSLAATNDGSVVVWGNLTGPIARVPPGLAQVTALAAGDSHALALQADGTVVAWGDNYYGQCEVPAGLSGVLAVAAGYAHSVALKSDGTVVVWGRDFENGPRVPAGLVDVVGIAAGDVYTLARKSDGTVVGWGLDSYGETVATADLGSVFALAAGTYVSLALDDASTAIIAPAITVQPGNQVVVSGQTATFATQASGSGLSYRWQSAYSDWSGEHWSFLYGDDGWRYSGVQTPTLMVANNHVANSGERYRCLVSNNAGNVATVEVTLTVAPTPPVITTQPADTLASVGGTAPFFVQADSEVPLAYRWQMRLRDELGWTDLVEAPDTRSPASAQTSITATLARHGAQFRSVVSNSAGSVTSDPARLLIREALTLAVSGSQRTVAVVGTTVTFTATASSTLGAPLAYQWKKGNRPIAGATTATLTLANFASDDAGAYVIEVTDPFGGVSRATRFVLPDGGPTQVRGWGLNASSQAAPPLDLTSAIEVTAGANHSVALKADGTVLVWGDTSQGQLPVSAPSDVVALSAYGPSTAALRSDGSLRIWGPNNSYGGQTDLIAIALGGTQVLGLRSDGTLYGMNLNYSVYPPLPTGLRDITGIAVGGNHALVCKRDGSVVAWRTDFPAPMFVPASLGRVVAVAAGERHALALQADGTVAAWGENAFGQSSVPAGLSGVVAIAAGPYTSLAKKSDGTLVVWGRDTNGESTPPADLGAVAALAGGGRHSLALRSSVGDAAPVIIVQPEGLQRTAGGTATLSVTATGAVPLYYQWRRNGVDVSGATAAALVIPSVTGAHSGRYDVVIRNHVGTVVSAIAQLVVVGANVPPFVSQAPVARQTGVPGQPLTLAVAAVSANQPLSYQWKRNNRPIVGATGSSCTVASFSNADAGAYTLEITDSQGLKTYVTSFVLPRYTITQVKFWGSAGSPAPVIPADAAHLVGLAPPIMLRADGTVATWVPSSQDMGRIPSGVTDAVAVRAGGSNALAVRADGTLTIWGSSSYGALLPPAGLSDVIGASVGGGHVLALKSDGTVTGWGLNFNGQAAVPAGLSGVVQVAAGGAHSLALKLDGTVVAWGGNGSGQTAVPAGLGGVVAIAAGGSTSFAVKADGSIVAWGLADYSGQTTVPGAAVPAVAVAAGTDHAVAVKADGTLVSWGANTYGQQTVPAGLDHIVQASVVGGATFVLRDASADAPPTIIAQPANALRAIGQSLTLAVTATGPGPFTYQWRLDGSPLAGKTAPSLPFDDIQLADAGSYDVVVGNHNGSVTSDVATVTVLPPPAITTAPAHRVIAMPGQALTLAVTATSANAPLAYQWRRNNRLLPGATSSTYSLAAFANNEAGTYTLEITDRLGLKTWFLCYVPPYYARTQLLGWGKNFSGESTPPAGNLPFVSVVAVPDRSFGVTRDGAVVAIGSSGSYSPVGATDVVTVAGNLVLKSDGTVAPWPNYPYAPVMPPQWRDLVDLQAGRGYLLALKADGTVLAWGNNDYGQTNVPAGLTGVVSIAAGELHAMAVRNDGRVVIWGTNVAGAGAAPAWDDLSGATFAAAGYGHSSVVKADGRIVSWGLLGGEHASPPEGFVPASRVAAGENHVVALNVAGEVTAWGATEYGQAQVPAAARDGVVAIFAGTDQSFALRDATDDTIPLITVQPASLVRTVGQVADFSVTVSGRGPFSYQWRKNGSVLVGANASTLSVSVETAGVEAGYDVVVTNHVGSVTSVPAILTTRPLVGVALLSAAWQTPVPGQNVTLGVSAAGTGVLHYQWFHNGLPVAGATGSSLGLVQVGRADSGYYFVDVADDYGTHRSPAYFVLVAPVSTRVVGFGSNYFGQSQIPADLIDAVAIAAGSYHSVALRRDGTVRVWGSDAGYANAVPVGLTDVVAVAAGYNHSLALKSDGTVVEWGWYSTGPVPLSGVVAIAADDVQSIAVLADGSVVTWDATRPFGIAPLPAPAGLKAVGYPAIGFNHAVALRADGTPVVWGGNTYGQTEMPAGLSGVVALAAGSGHTLAVKSSGEVVAWGYNLAGQTAVPAELGNVVAVAAGGSHSLALKSDGSVVAWGYSTYGETSVPAGLADVFAIAAGGSYSLALREWVSDAPLILSQPSARYVLVPEAANFSIVASGQGVLSYQWQRRSFGTVDWTTLADGGLFSGVNTPNLSVGPTTLAMEGDDFRCVVSNSVGSVTSEAAYLGPMPSAQHAPVVTLMVGSQQRIGQTLGITLRARDSDGDFSFASLWVRTPAGIWRLLKTDGSTVPSHEFSFANASVTATGTFTFFFPFVPADGAGTYTIAAAAMDASGLRSDTSVDVVVEPNRPPIAELYLSGHHTIGESIVLSFRIDDPDNNFAFSVLRVNTPNRGWLTLRAGNTIALSGDVTDANSSALNRGYGTREFTFTATDGPGLYTFALSVVDSLGERVDAPLGVVTVVAPLTRYEAWRVTYFTAAERPDLTVSGPNADPDGDGLTNLIEYALALDPRSSDSGGLPDVRATATDWVYTYTRPSDRIDITYEVEVSTDLTNWATAGVTHELVSTGAGTETWRGRYPLSSAANVFFRLKVVQ